jgi:hypothetical protein
MRAPPAWHTGPSRSTHHRAPQEEWPEVYWNALRRMAQGRPVPVPQPHPTIALADMQRIAAQGPRFSDLVLEHAERVYDPGGRGRAG